MQEASYRQAKEDDWSWIYELVFLGQGSWPGERTESLEELKDRLQRPVPQKEVWVGNRSVAIWFPEIFSIEPRPEAKESDIHLAAFFVHPDRWGDGSAGRFMDFCLRRVQEGGSSHIRLWTPQEAQRARAFYEKQGWQDSGRRKLFKGLVRAEYTKTLP